MFEYLGEYKTEKKDILLSLVALRIENKAKMLQCDTDDRLDYEWTLFSIKSLLRLG